VFKALAFFAFCCAGPALAAAAVFLYTFGVIGKGEPVDWAYVRRWRVVGPFGSSLSVYLRMLQAVGDSNWQRFCSWHAHTLAREQACL